MDEFLYIRTEQEIDTMITQTKQFPNVGGSIDQESMNFIQCYSIEPLIGNQSIFPQCNQIGHMR